MGGRTEMMSTTSARPGFASTHRIGLAGLVLAAILVAGAGAGSKGQAAPVSAPVVAAIAERVPAGLGSASTGTASASAPLVSPASLPDDAVDRLAASAPGLQRDVLRLALSAREAASARGLVRKDDLLTVIDYSLPSTAKRLWVLDLSRGEVLFNELVAHGKNTGENFARHFSNRDRSLQTSLGLFRTVGTYNGSNGYSLKLDGLEPGYNDQAARRAVVMHGAPYVSAEFATEHGRIGRSWGCPALSEKVAAKVIDTIKGGSLVFSYFPDEEWLGHSSFLGSSGAGATVAAR